jgi:basic membrane protein A
VVSEIMESGFDQGVADFELVSRKVSIQDMSGFDDAIQEVSAANPALVVLGTGDLDAVASEFPRTNYLQFTPLPSTDPNVITVRFRTWEASFLVGVAAAETTKTGTIGFVGGLDFAPIWGFQAGYAAGAATVSPDITILTTYLEPTPQPGQQPIGEGFSDTAGARSSAEQMYGEGADVIFQAAGEAGLGVFDAAVSQADAHPYPLWVIGVDSDQYVTVTQLPGVTNADAWRPHILTSMIKRFDDVIYDNLQRVAGGNAPASPQVYDLASGMLDISYSGGFIDDLRSEIEDYRRRIIAGQIDIPCLAPDAEAAVRAAAPEVGVPFEDLMNYFCP